MVPSRRFTLNQRRHERPGPVQRANSGYELKSITPAAAGRLHISLCKQLARMRLKAERQQTIACANALVLHNYHPCSIFRTILRTILHYLSDGHFPLQRLQMRQLPREEYTVGWVCALPVELAEALGMLDEEHKDLEGDDNDENLYSLGSVVGHDVVIVCLPAGRIGDNPPAAVATQTRSTFKGIRSGLMVDIGGGVPSAEADIRLGDVVQYDAGKTTPSGFERTGSLSAPPQILLAAVARVRANELRGRSKLSEYVSKISRIPRFQRKKAGPDVLFEAAYDHQGGPTCDRCNTDREKARQLRDSKEKVVVHYGTIVSGNQVMRDGRTRDRLSKELASILYFEMEAAGLMNSFPCLAIRGICDYADSHKNKTWQPYAAGTAAAYAKEMLSLITPADVARTRTVDEAIRSINQKLDVVDKKTDTLLSKIDIAKLPIAEGASFNPHDEEHNARCFQNTRTSLLKMIAEWANDKGSKPIFWLCGMAGTGKSTTARYLIISIL